MKNTKNILIKNMLDACIGALSFWLLGYAFAFGDNNRFIGKSSEQELFCIICCSDEIVRNIWLIVTGPPPNLNQPMRYPYSGHVTQANQSGAEGFALKTFDTRTDGSSDKLYQGKNYAFFLFQWAFAATAATIVSGKLNKYFLVFFFGILASFPQLFLAYNVTNSKFPLGRNILNFTQFSTRGGLYICSWFIYNLFTVYL